MGGASNGGIVVSGCVLQQPVRDSRLGTWHLAAAPDGSRAGILLLRPDADVDLLVACTSALMHAGLPGVLPVRDLVSQRGRFWLVVDDAPAPTLAQLLAGTALGVGTATYLLTALGDTLRALHERGIAHGNLSTDTVVIGSDGTPRLADWGAVADPTPAADAAAWANIAEQLAAAWSSGDRAAAAALHRAAGLAASGSLPAAVTALGAGMATLHIDRDSTTRLVSQPVATALQFAARPADPTVVLGSTVLDGIRPTDPDQSLLPHDDLTNRLSAPPEVLAGTANGTPVAPSPATVSRFGPGIPPAGAQKAWRGSQPSPGPRAAWFRRRYARTVGALVVLAVIAVAALWWTQRSAVDVSGVQVRIDAAGGCGSTAHVVGVISTNGEPGTISYRWIRSDTGPGPLLAQAVGSEKEARVALEWTIHGQGSLTAHVELEILAPRTLTGSGQFRYTCS